MRSVLILFSSSEVGGAEHSLSRMAFGSGDTDVHYIVATLGGPEGAWVKWVKEQGRDPVVLGPDQATSRAGYYLSAARALAAAWRRTSPDIIYVVGLKAALLARCLKLIMPATKIVHAIRTNLPEGSTLARNFAISERVLGFCTHGYVANSRVAAQRLTELAGIPDRRIAVIYNGLDADESETVGSPDVRRKEICVVANINRYKGHLEFLDVIARLRSQIPDILVTFVGRDDLDGQLAREIDARGLAANINMVGFQSKPETFLKRAQVFVLPSRSTEGTPTSILEAFKTCTPVVAYAIGGIPELVTHGVDGLLVEPGDEDGMTRALVELLQDPPTAARMGQRGREKLVRHFTLRACAERHKEYWNNILKSSS